MYSNLKDILNIIPEKELVNLTNDEITSDSKINQDVLNLAINHADNLIDCALRVKYKLPLSFVPPVITTLSTDISAYRVYIRRPADIPEHIVKNYDKALSILEKISTGKMLLDLPNEHPDENIQHAASTIRVNKKSSDRIFNERFLNTFRSTI